MPTPLWKPRNGELLIEFEPEEQRLYELDDPAGRYHAVRWPHRAGRGKHGEFPLVVAREYFRAQGYTVWASEPELPYDAGFILVSYPGKRYRGHPAYGRMEALFGVRCLRELNVKTDRAKLRHTRGRGGGDPDLFVFGGSKRFFVEVKWRDRLLKKQKVTFPIIEKMCRVEIKVARIKQREPLAG